MRGKSEQQELKELLKELDIKTEETSYGNAIYVFHNEEEANLFHDIAMEKFRPVKNYDFYAAETSRVEGAKIITMSNSWTYGKEADGHSLLYHLLQAYKERLPSLDVTSKASPSAKG